MDGLLRNKKGMIVLDDKILGYNSPCGKCSHYIKYEFFEDKFSCNAFPNGTIPEEIYSGNNRHDKPFPGDNGIIFKDSSR